MACLKTDYSKICQKIFGSNYENMHLGIFPKNIFMILAGGTGSGKTNLMMNFIMENVIHYDDIMIYTNTPNQDFYKYLRLCNDESKKKNKSSRDVVTFHNPEDGIAHPSTLDKNKTHVIIFDDVMTENQKDMVDYFCYGRHTNVNVFYLCQSLHLLPKHGIRQNANIFILFHQDAKTIKYFHETHISGDMPLDEFKKICDDAWSTEHGYIVINLWEEPKHGRYVLNYNRLYIPEKYPKIPINTY